jgi:O-antigen/teichoic acid export membrane protein
VRWGFLPVVALGLFIGATSPWILQLFGESYTEASGFLWLLIGGLIIRSLVGPAESLLTMVGQERACAAAYGLTLLVNVVLNLLLIPQFGLWGAAMATATSMVVEALALWLVVKRRLGFSVFVI